MNAAARDKRCVHTAGMTLGESFGITKGIRRPSPMMGQGFQLAVEKISVAVLSGYPRGQYPSCGIHAAGAFRPTSDRARKFITLREERMDQRRRMYRTLGCLAGAMTGTASLLAWIDPSPSPPPRILSQYELAVQARSLVFDDVSLRLGQWRHVEIVEGPSLQSAGVLLTAGVDRSESHFYVDDHGRLSRTRQWDRQLAPSNAPHTIRIEIAHDDTELSPTTAQSNSVQALLDALNEAVSARHPL